MDEDTSTTHGTYKISEATRELGISAEWLRKAEERGFFPPAHQDPHSGRRYYTPSDIERLRQSHRTGRRVHG